MPITGRFEADFSSFQSAVNAAESTLSGFESRSGKVESSLNRMGNSLSGTKLIQDAVLMAKAVDDLGGTSKLTDTELERLGKQATEAAEKMRAIGLQVPENLQRIQDEAKNTEPFFGSLQAQIASAFSVGAILRFGEAMIASAIDSASALTDLSAKTGASVEQLQRWQFAGKQAGVTVEDLAQSSFKLGVNIAGGTEKARQATADLGLAYADLRKQSPDDQFNATVAALERMVDPQERNRIGVDLFGKTFATVAQLVGSGYSDIAGQAEVSSGRQVRALDDLGDAWDRYKANFDTAVRSQLGATVIAAEEFGKLSTAQQALLVITGALGGGTAGLGAALNVLNESAARRAAQVDHDLPAQKSLADVTESYVRQLAAADDVVKRLSATERAGITAALELGESHDKIATAFRLSDEELTRYIRLQQDVTAAEKTAAREREQIADENVRILNKQYDEEFKAAEAAQKKIQAANDAWAATMRKVEDQGRSLQDRLLSVDGTIVEWAEHLLQSGVDAKTVAEYYGLTDGQVRALTEDLRRASEAAKAAGASMGSDLLIVGKSADEAAAKVDKLYQTFQLLGQGMGLTLGQTVTPTGRLLPNDPNVGESNVSGVFAQAMAVPRFAGGVENFRGGAAIVGEAGPELVNLPRGSSVTPAGRFGGGSTIVVQNTFHIVDTASNVARQAADQILASIKRASLLTAS